MSAPAAGSSWFEAALASGDETLLRMFGELRSLHLDTNPLKVARRTADTQGTVATTPRRTR